MFRCFFRLRSRSSSSSFSNAFILVRSGTRNDIIIGKCSLTVCHNLCPAGEGCAPRTSRLHVRGKILLKESATCIHDCSSIGEQPKDMDTSFWKDPVATAGRQGRLVWRKSDRLDSRGQTATSEASPSRDIKSSGSSSCGQSRWRNAAGWLFRSNVDNIGR